VLMLKESAGTLLDYYKNAGFGVTDPEADKVPGSPLPALWLDWFQVVVDEHELLRRQARLALHRKLPGETPKF
jgi:hypothetical protein